MLTSVTKPQTGWTDRLHDLGYGFCEEKQRLLDGFLKATREMCALHKQQMEAVIEGDTDFSRFDVLIHLAQERKDRAKYAWIAHVESHRCGS
jgi:hypothetical protein